MCRPLSRRVSKKEKYEKLYACSNINLFNGSLNLTLPLMKIGGQGEAGMVMSLPIESHWTNLYFFDNPMGGFFNPIPQYNFPNGLEPGYGPGVPILRGARHNFGLCGGGQFGDLEPNKPSTVWGNTPIRARYQLPWNIVELSLWNPAWATLDAARIETIRGMNVDSTLMTPKKEGGHYGLQPPPK